MPTPTLLHPIPVKIRKADREQTAVWDENFREPVGQVRRKQNPIELIAQVKNKKEDRAVATEGGTSLQSDGYLLFLWRDLINADVTIEQGDRVVEIGSGDSRREVDYYIFETTGRGHYPEHGGHTLLKAFYQDRAPANVRNDGRR
jgi:hypothetical protein